ncbi:MAG: sugar ABC transporter permease [Clostridia bacterium]|nr:sugar ABC transporter permease [Clostridia bacterium]
MNRRREAAAGLAFLLPSLLGMVVFTLFPFVKSLYYTFTQGITQVRFVGLENFSDLVSNPAFTLAVRNTLVFMGAGIPMLLAVSIFLSICVKGDLFRRLSVGYLAPLVVPISAVVYGWQFLLGEKGLIAGAMTALGLESVNLLADRYAMPVSLLIFVWKNTGYISVILSSAITAIPKEYYEVFYLDSSSEIKLATSVIIPLILPMMFFALIISMMNSFKAFREIHVMYGSMPPKNIYMLQHFMNNNFTKLNYQRLTTAAVLLVGLLLVFIVFFLWGQRRLSNRLEG